MSEEYSAAEDSWTGVPTSERAYIREVTEELRPIRQAYELGMGIPVFCDEANGKVIMDYGPYMTINALRLAVDKRLADPSFDSNEILFRFWTPQPPHSLKRKHRRVAMKATMYMTEDGHGWLLLEKPTK